MKRLRFDIHQSQIIFQTGHAVLIRYYTITDRVCSNLSSKENIAFGHSVCSWWREPLLDSPKLLRLAPLIFLVLLAPAGDTAVARSLQRQLNSGWCGRLRLARRDGAQEKARQQRQEEARTALGKPRSGTSATRVAPQATGRARRATCRWQLGGRRSTFASHSS